MEMTKIKYFYILITLKQYWDQVGVSQGLGRLPVRNTRNYKDMSAALFSYDADQLVGFISKFGDVKFKRICLVRQADDFWTIEEITESFAYWGIRSNDLDIHRPFGAYATPTLWHEYVQKYIKTMPDSDDVIYSKLGITNSAWISCLEALDKNRIY